MLLWPLRHNEIRRNSASNAYGMVRNGGARAHQGWDLKALPWTSCFAIADGEILDANIQGDFGLLVLLKFTYRAKTWYAAYAHLSYAYVQKKGMVTAGQLIAETGNTGNASSMTGEDQHLHFEIRNQEFPGKGLGGRVDPAKLYGASPLKYPIFESRHSIARSPVTGQGLKAEGVNVL